MNWTSLKGKWASLACHETGALVVQVQKTFSSDYQATFNPFYSTRLKTLKPKLRMELSMSCSIKAFKGLQYLAKSPRASGVPIATSRNSEFFFLSESYLYAALLLSFGAWI